MTKGFVIMAQDNPGATVYQDCAKALEASLKNVMPDANVTIVTTADLPHGDLAPNSDWLLRFISIPVRDAQMFIA